MLLSIGVILYNNANNVVDLMKSLLDQTDLRFSVIIIDNNSSDDSFELVAPFESDFTDLNIPFRTFRNSQNIGELNALRELSEACATEFIAIVHGDDLLMKHFVEDYNQEIEANGNLRVANTSLRTIVNQTLTSTILRPRWTKWVWLNRLLGFYGNPGLMPGALFKTTLLHGLTAPIGEYRLLFNADSLLWFRLMKETGNISLLKNLNYIYVRGEQQSSSSRLNDEMMALSRFLRITESKTRLQQILAISGTEFDRNFVDFSNYMISLKSLLPNIQIPRYAKLLNRVYSLVSVLR